MPGNNGNPPAPTSLNQQQMLNQIQALQLLQQQQKQVSLHSLQQVTQMLASQQLAKQQLQYQLNQLKLVKPGSGNGGSSSGQAIQQQQQQLLMSLNKINSKISATSQQLMAMEQVINQKLQAGSTSNGLGMEGGSSAMGLPGKEHRSVGSGAAVQQRPVSLNTTNNVGEGKKQPGYAVQGLPPVGSSGQQQTSVSQMSARTMSRLQQIISGSGDFAGGETVDKDGMEMGVVGNELGLLDTDSHPKVPSPSMQQQQSHQLTSSSSPDSMVSSMHPSTVANTPSGFTSRSAHPNLVSSPSTVSSSSSVGLPFASSTRSVDEIPEFKPGVPWQPRNQPTEPAQAYGDQAFNKVPGVEVNPKFPPQSLTRSNSSSYPNSEDYYSPHDGGSGMYGGGGFGSSSAQYHHNSGRAGRQEHIHRQYSTGSQPRAWDGYRKNSQGGYRGGTGGGMGPGSGSSGQYHDYGGLPQHQQQHHPGHTFHHGRGRARPQQHQTHHKGFTSSGGYPMSGGAGTGGGRRHDQYRSTQQHGGGMGYESRRWSHDNGNPWGVPARSTSGISSSFGGEWYVF